MNAAAVRALALAELNAHTPPGVAVADETTFGDLQMDPLDIFAFAYGVETELAGFDTGEVDWDAHTSIGKALADILDQHQKAHKREAAHG